MCSGESVDDHAEMDLFSTTDTDLDRQFRLAELKLGNEGVGIPLWHPIRR